MKREAAALVRCALVFGGKQSVKAEARRKRRKGGLVPSRRVPVKPLIELRDKTRESGVGLFHIRHAVQSDPDGQTALLTSPTGARYGLWLEGFRQG
jgi:hypothetical protein